MHPAKAALPISRTFSPNLRTIKAEVDGEVKKIHVCAKCLRSGKVKRA